MSKTNNPSSRAIYRRKTLISYLLCFFIAISVCICLLCMLLKGGIFSDTVFLKSLNESSFFDEKTLDMQEQISNSVVEAGLPEKLAEEVITNRMVVLHANEVVNGTIEGKKVVLDTTELENALRTNIVNYIKEQGIDNNNLLDKSVDILVKEASAEYATQMTFKFANFFVDSSSKYVPLLNLLIIVTVAIFVVCSILCVLVHKRKYRGVRYVSYGILSGSVLSGIISVLMKKEIYEVVSVGDSKYYEVIRNYISNSFDNGLYICFGGIMVFCVVVCLTIYLRKEAV